MFKICEYGPIVMIAFVPRVHIFLVLVHGK